MPMRTINDFMKAYDYWIVSTFGYELAVRIEDFLFGLSMIFIGVIIFAFLSSIFIRNIHSVDDFKESGVQSFHLKNKKTGTRTIKIRNIKEAFEQILIFSLSFLFTFKRYEKRDERRTKRFVKIIIFIAILIIIWGVFTTFTVLTPI